MTESQLFQALQKEAKRRIQEIRDERYLLRTKQFKTKQSLPEDKIRHAKAMNHLRVFHMKSFMKGGMFALECLKAERTRRKSLE